jgi:hypothetical protein
MTQTDLSKQMILSAITQIGVQEVPKGSNKGVDVEKYLKSIGLGGGYSWCMAFAYWNVQQAATKLGIANPLFKTGGVLAQWNNRIPLQTSIPQPGYLFVIDEGKGEGHTGIVEYVVGDTIHTIEGNTNDDGSREGYEVCRRVRKISSCKGFIKI